MKHRINRYHNGLILLVSIGAACKQPQPPQQTQLSGLPKITITADAKQLLTYFDSSTGAFKSVTAIDDIPETSRNWVRVVLLETKPDQRTDHELVYVANFTSAQSDNGAENGQDKETDKETDNEPHKSYAYVVVSRAAFELAARRGGPQAHAASEGVTGEPNAAASNEIVLYGTRWCGACRSARQFFTQKGIPFVDKDIEADPNAAAELMQKAKRAGITPGGVPVIDVRGTLVSGFNAQRLEQLLGGTR